MASSTIAVGCVAKAKNAGNAPNEAVLDSSNNTRNGMESRL